ncbi:hypothetical protein N7478_009244 [Penicillium angulare]|uniref:uncharacterized protein n=1 Tax=Penicillium angulare TaxID=116970 RepID=UPI00253F8DE1|nr:uncharacterized protein N7478_009244 [Penicillium angulare]KAJ5274119.1 hypothetical protein N7478_009244 [Penicillium angulare]
MYDTVPDTPIRAKKATEPVAPDTPEDDGDYDTIATVPLAHPSLTPSQRFTQPTQLVEMPNPHSNSRGSIIQVAQSSPTAPATSPPRRGGLLSSLMAPSGTQFRPPANAARPAKRPVIDLDDAPTYRGGSSDEESNYTIRSTDIKPSMFEKTRSPEKVSESPVRANGAMDRFKEITASAIYDPSINGVKRSADQMSPNGQKGVAIKKFRQVAPSRALPVTDKVLDVQAIDDYRVRVKVERMLSVMPNKSVDECVSALILMNGNYDNALDHLSDHQALTKNGSPILINSSDDELSAASTPAPAAPMAKQQIKARGTIHDKWTARNLQTSRNQGPAEDVKPGRRLMRGPRSRENSSIAPITIDSDNDSQPKKKAGRLQKGRRDRSLSRSESIEAAMSDSDDSDVRVQDHTLDALSSKVLKFFNTCNARDLADIVSVPEDTASHIISFRPFHSLDDVRAVPTPVDPSKPKPKGKPRKAPVPIGQRIVEKCTEMWNGYLAIDSLVAECEALGKPVATEMKKWGVDMFGKADGDFDLVSMNKANAHDSGIATPSSNHPSGNDSDDEGPVTTSRKSKTNSGFISQPSIMADDLVMKDYQVVGINWLALLFQKKLSCILADDMGLGKTCQVIAFLAHLYEIGIKGPHLIVVPSSTIENWLREFQKFCPALSVIPYYAGQNERAELREQIEDNRDNINVVITTYTIARGKLDAKFLRDQDFTACVYDEGHMLKNHQSQLYDKLVRIRAKFRLLLTGTPLQNNLQELASLLGFILPGVFNEHKEDLQAVFSNKAKTSDDSHAALLSVQRIERAKSMLKPFVLRRKKHQVIDLPAKHSYVKYCAMKSSQIEIYEHEQEQVRQLLADRAAGKKTGSKSANILMKLRQAAIHPLLARRHYDQETLRKMSKACLKEPQWSLSDPDTIYTELENYNDFECHSLCSANPSSLGKFKLKNDEWMDSGKIDQLRELLLKFIANGDRTLIFSQFTLVMDILEHVLETLRIEFVRLDGRTNVEDRQSILDAFYEREEIPVFLLSTKAGGAGINLACANKVIIFDSSFNPQEDVQAENRAHRVGQTRDVEIFRFVTSGTIEEQIYALGQTKLALDQAVAGDDAEASKKGEEAGLKAVESMFVADMENKKAEK